ncbi:MAG: protein phosphatase 2C domain-containing protein [Anaerolineales bacterium]|jgi:protein phosphatase|nr:protein phosphatase 2C domain-containing protein [Anaerolineales bacterium]
MITTQTSHLMIASATHAGMRGKNNEDRFGIFTYQRSADDPTPVVFTVLCDGVGGHCAGEVAAELAVEAIRWAIAESNADQPLAVLRQGILSANQAILDHAGEDPERKGMGSTCVCAWVIGDRLFTAAVGDSRLYLLRNAAIRQVTTDHTWVQEALEYGVLTPEQARKHPNQHVIRRYLGSQEPPQVDFRLKLSDTETDEQAEANQGLRLQPGDCLVLCSDGLSDLVTADEILKALQIEKDASQALVSLANARGGHDNITVILLKYPSPSEAKTVVSLPSNARTQVQADAHPVVSQPDEPAPDISTAQSPASRKKWRLTLFSCLVLILVLAMMVWFLARLI